MTKILGISASPRNEATDFVVRKALEKAQESGVETEYISLRGKKIRNCNHCDYCMKNKSACVIKDDMIWMTEKFLEADGYIIGSPVYTYNPTPEIITFFNRLRPMRFSSPQGSNYKVGGAISVGGTRNGGQEMTINSLINCYLARGIVVVGGSIGNYAGGKVWTNNQGKIGAENDEIGLLSVSDLGQRVAEVALLLKGNEK